MELQIYGVTYHRKIIETKNWRNVMKDIKKILICLVCSSVLIGLFNINVRAEENGYGCPVRTLIDHGTVENQEFLNAVMNNENLDFTDENIIIEYYADGTASITHIVDQNLVEVFTPLTKSDEEAIKNISNAKNQERSAGLILLWQGIVELGKFVGTAGSTVSWACKVISITGLGNPCEYVTKALVNSIGSAPKARFEITQYMQKDASCPYPPNSLQCSQPPYAYKKTTYRRVA